MFPVLVLLLWAIALGVGTYLAALNVRFRDVRFVVPFLIQFWFFATPIIYPASMVPEQYRLFYFLNPLAGIIEGFRVSLLSGVNGASFNWMAIGIASIVTIAILVAAAYEFRRMERGFADII